MSVPRTRGFKHIVALIKARKAGTALALLALVIAALSIESYRVANTQSPRTPFEHITVTRLTNFGDALFPSISADGRYVTYAKGARTEGPGRFSIWLREIGTTHETPVVPPTAGYVISASLSPDGNTIAYVAPSGNGPYGAYIRPVSGGGALKLTMARFIHWVVYSPDGKRIAFWYNNFREGETPISIARADGTGALEIATRQAPDTFWPRTLASWSPDGKLIACIGRNGAETFPRVFVIDVEARTDRPLTSQRWTDMNGVAWLSDMSGLLLTAAEETSSIQQIWHVSYPEGLAQRVTNDTINYSHLSLAADGKALVTTQVVIPTSIWVLPVNPAQPGTAGGETVSVDGSRARQIYVGNTVPNSPSNFRLAWTPDGRIVYTSEESGNADIWSMNRDGSDRRQLTSDPHPDNAPAASPDGRYVAFVSKRNGSESIWLMRTDGEIQQQLTRGLISRRPVFSADSKWVYFNDWRTHRLAVWKIRVEGGDPSQVLGDVTENAEISPDGRLLAYSPEGGVAVAPVEGGRPIQTFRPAGTEYAWSPDGRALTFLSQGDDGVINLWVQPLDGSQPRKLTNFSSDPRLVSYAWSPDGKQLAVRLNTIVSDVVLIRDSR